MSLGFLKKALETFVEFEPEKASERGSIGSAPRTQTGNTSPKMNDLSDIRSGNTATVVSEISAPSLENMVEAEKFINYFDNLFNNANFPGPDYFEFNKTMETLEQHIKDDDARISATFASLAIQGLTKDTLINSAKEYQRLIQKDKESFEAALAQKMSTDIGSRESERAALQDIIKGNDERIQKMLKDSKDAQLRMERLSEEIKDAEDKSKANSQGYVLASTAMSSHIQNDLDKINRIIK